MTKSIVLQTEIDGVEFYTVQATGDSGMSQRGLARFCGVDEKSVRNLGADLLEGKTASEWLESCLDKELYLRSEEHTGNVKIIRSEVCAAIIQHFAFAGRGEAKFALKKFAAIGINAWLQQVNHWQQPAQESLAGVFELLAEYKRDITVLQEKQKAYGYALANKNWLANCPKEHLPYNYLDRIAQISKKKAARTGNGWIRARDISAGVSGKNKPNAKQCRIWMQELAALGKGIVRGSGTALEYCHTSPIETFRY